MPQKDFARWRGNISVSYQQWSTEFLLKRLKPERHGTTGDIQQCRCTTEVPRLRDRGKCLQLLTIKIHVEFFSVIDIRS